MKVRLFNLKKNKRFNYTPRYYDGGKDAGNSYSFESRFTKYRDTTNTTDFGSQWREARQASRNRKNRGVNRRLLIIFAILLLIALYFIDFDLSIFRRNS